MAARRISVDPRWVAAMGRRAVGRRAEATTDTVSAWKRTRARVAHRRPAASAEATPVGARFEADASDERTAIDVGEAPADRRERPAEVRPRPTEADAGPADDEGDYTSRLLAAKRRARQQSQGEEGPDA